MRLLIRQPSCVMAGLDPAIHEKRRVDARLKAGHDGSGGGPQG